MLTAICQYLKNWFNRKPDGSDYPKYEGTFTIQGGVIDLELESGQYFRVMGSLFNDGVHKAGDTNDVLTDETFTGAVWFMGIPPEVVQLATDISQWQEKYGGIDSEALSPYASESFGGYSYSKGGGGASCGSNVCWQDVYGGRLQKYRRLRGAT